MKKWLIGLLFLGILTTGMLYFFIPNIFRFKSTVRISVTRPGLYRMLNTKENVMKWWPGNIIDSGFYMKDMQYTFNQNSLSVIPVSLAAKKTQLPTSLLIIEHAKDDTQLDWVGAMATSYNPVKRFFAYLEAKKIQQDMNVVLNKMQEFYSQSKNIYGFDIKSELVADSILIQTSGISKQYPSTDFIYSLIDKLNSYATLNQAKVSGYPMLNIRLADSTGYEVKVALPVDKTLPNVGNILQKRMLGKGNILVTEVKGGISVGKKAFYAIQKYAEDYQRVAPAIPFYSLITNRLEETDSTKWITKIYYPVM
jgi:hypothetical protein